MSGRLIGSRSAALDAVGVYMFGNGEDGDVVFGAGTTTLARDMYYASAIVPAGAIVKTANFKMFVAGQLTIAGGAGGGVIQCNGNDAVADVAGAALVAGTVGAGPGMAGGAGGTGVGGGGTGITYTGPVTAAGGTGGSGGAGSGGAGGLFGAQTNGGVTASTMKAGGEAALGKLFDLNGAAIRAGFGGTGGGAGGGNGAQKGGGGGGGAGYLFIAAKTIANGGTISANGGAGANGTSNNCGGGGGGGGGIVEILTRTPGLTGTVTASGGAPGASGGGTGVAGSAGSAGRVIVMGA